MANPLKLCILIGDKSDRPPAEVDPGYDIVEIPVSLQLLPLESNTNWAKKRDEIQSWNLPPVKVSSHFLGGRGLRPTGPDVDWELLEFWTKRAFDRLQETGVENVGVYGGFFSVPDGFSRTQVMDQAIRFTHLLADQAEARNMVVALEPMSDLNTLWPRYLEGLAFAKEIDRPAIRVMADIAYFLDLDQPLDHIAEAPEYCVHCHIAGEKGQPGVGDRVAVHTRLFEIFKDIGYEGAVSCACPWVSTEGGELRFGPETTKTLHYLQKLRDQVYKM